MQPIAAELLPQQQVNHQHAHAQSRNDHAIVLAAIDGIRYLPPPHSELEFMMRITRLLYRPHHVTQHHIAHLALPPDASPNDLPRLHQGAFTLFARRYLEMEDEVFTFVRDDRDDQPVPDSLSMSMRKLIECCSGTSDLHTLGHRMRHAPADVFCRAVRAHLRDRDDFLHGLALLHAYLAEPIVPGASGAYCDDYVDVDIEPPVELCRLWPVITFDARPQPKDALRDRRRRTLARMHVETMFHGGVPPEPDHPFPSEVRAYWEWSCHFGDPTDRQSIVFVPIVVRQALMERLRRTFPEWTPERLFSGRPIEVFDAVTLTARCAVWNAGCPYEFPGSMNSYLMMSLDSYQDRAHAMMHLLRTEARARECISPRYAAHVFQMREAAEHDNDRVQAFFAFSEKAWCAPNRLDHTQLLQSARRLVDGDGDQVSLGVLIRAVMPELPAWPCDVVFVGAMFDLCRTSRNQSSLLKLVSQRLVSVDATYMNWEPLWRRVPVNVRATLIETWSREPQSHIQHSQAMLFIYQAHATHQELSKGLDARSRVLNMRRREQLPKYIQDCVSTVDERNCVACETNERRVCFTPCGHIVLCLACFARCSDRCPTCRTPITSSQACHLP